MMRRGSNHPDDEAAVGYRNPPVSGRFRKGQSGNNRGRPPGRRKEAPYEAVLGQMVTIREDGAERQVTAAEAFLLQITKRGLEGDSAAARAAMAAIEEARTTRLEKLDQTITVITISAVAPGSVNSALVPLRMARKLNRHHATARIALEPWLVEAAIARLGDRRLSAEEQEKVMRATRTPGKVNWPDWWKVKP